MIFRFKIRLNITNSLSGLVVWFSLRVHSEFNILREVPCVSYLCEASSPTWTDHAIQSIHGQTHLLCPFLACRMSILLYGVTALCLKSMLCFGRVMPFFAWQESWEYSNGFACDVINPKHTWEPRQSRQAMSLRMAEELHLLYSPRKCLSSKRVAV